MIRVSEAMRAVAGKKHVVLRTKPGEIYAEGQIMAYSLVPQVMIETADGQHIWWRHDMAEIVEKN